MKLEKIRQVLMDGKFLGGGDLHEIDLDEILDTRKEESFDSFWINSFKKFESLPLSELDREEIDKIRELAFKQTHKFTDNSELSAYISDDFELISRAIIVEADDPFINSLWSSYRSGIIPHGEIELIEGKINKI